jgi:hypothetical protein
MGFVSDTAEIREMPQVLGQLVPEAGNEHSF